jgi:hypothetical protein
MIAAAALVVALASANSGTRVTAQECDPSYPDFCMDPPPPDLNCDEIPYRDFRVVAPDSHDFDGNNDGTGCESDTFGPASQPLPSQATPPGSLAETPVADATATPIAVPAAPDSGFGPDAFQPTSPTAWVLFGVVGAGVAWLSVGLVGAAVQSATARYVPLLGPRDRTRRQR